MESPKAELVALYEWLWAYDSPVLNRATKEIEDRLRGMPRAERDIGRAVAAQILSSRSAVAQQVLDFKSSLAPLEGEELDALVSEKRRNLQTDVRLAAEYAVLGERAGRRRFLAKVRWALIVIAVVIGVGLYNAEHPSTSNFESDGRCIDLRQC